MSTNCSSRLQRKVSYRSHQILMNFLGEICQRCSTINDSTTSATCCIRSICWKLQRHVTNCNSFQVDIVVWPTWNIFMRCGQLKCWCYPKQKCDYGMKQKCDSYGHHVSQCLLYHSTVTQEGSGKQDKSEVEERSQDQGSLVKQEWTR
jgi:hypothetical protein